MCGIFTEHVRHFGTPRDPAPQVLPELRRLLRQRMRRRNLLLARPAYLGYAAPNWVRDEAWPDLVGDCYLFILRRLESLRNQLRVRDDICGLFVLNVDHFLSERQRRYDPIGCAVFGNVEGGVRQARDAGDVTVEEVVGDRRQNASVVRFPRTPAEAETAEAETLRQILNAAPGWREAMSDLERITRKGQAWVATFLQQLHAAGIEAVRVRDLVRVVADRLRSDRLTGRDHSRTGVTVNEDEVSLESILISKPDPSVIDRDRWEWLKQKVHQRISGLERQSRLRSRLAGVFATLAQWIDEGREDFRQADLADHLQIPPTSLSDYFHLLGEIVLDVLGEKETGEDTHRPG